MENNQLFIYNTLTRKKELFVPLHAPHVGMYVCGLPYTVTDIWDMRVLPLRLILCSAT